MAENPRTLKVGIAACIAHHEGPRRKENLQRKWIKLTRRLLQAKALREQRKWVKLTRRLLQAEALREWSRFTDSVFEEPDVQQLDIRGLVVRTWQSRHRTRVAQRCMRRMRHVPMARAFNAWASMKRRKQKRRQRKANADWTQRVLHRSARTEFCTFMFSNHPCEPGAMESLVTLMGDGWRPATDDLAHMLAMIPHGQFRTGGPAKVHKKVIYANHEMWIVDSRERSQVCAMVSLVEILNEGWRPEGVGALEMLLRVPPFARWELGTRAVVLQREPFL